MSGGNFGPLIDEDTKTKGGKLTGPEGHQHKQLNGVIQMKTPVDYRIENIREVSFNGKKVKAFDSYVKQGDAFVYQGAYTAPIRTAAKNLWLIPNASDTGTVYD